MFGKKFPLHCALDRKSSITKLHVLLGSVRQPEKSEMRILKEYINKTKLLPLSSKEESSNGLWYCAEKVMTNN